MMSGNRWRLFCLYISFIGWDILSSLTLGIGSLWLRPYKQAATAAFHREVSGTVKERILTFLPKFEMYLGEQYIGCISKEFTFFKPKFNIDCNGWQVDGDWFEWDYSILDGVGRSVANVSKELWNWTDTYVIDVHDPQDALCALMLVLAIDAEKCSRSN